MEYVYHFCTTSQKTTGQVNLVDGLLILDYKVKNIKHYRSLKESIAEKFNLGVDHNNVSITSLTLISEES